MAMSSSRLATDMKSKIIAKLGLTTYGDAELQALSEAISEAVVYEMDNFASINGITDPSGESVTGGVS